MAKAIAPVFKGNNLALLDVYWNGIANITECKAIGLLRLLAKLATQNRPNGSGNCSSITTTHLTA